MKKTAFYLSVFGVLLITLFTGCDEELTSTPLSIDDLESATLRIYAKADLDLTSAGEESLPSGTIVTATVPYSQYSFVGVGGSPSTSIVVSESINESGYVEFTIPVDDDGVSATISINGFEYDQVQADGEVETKFYNFGTQTETITLGSSSISEFSGPTIVTIDESSDLLPATLVGNVTANINLQTAGNEAITQQPTIVVTKTGAEEFELETTLDASGQFSIDVDVNVDGTDDFEVLIRSFVADQTQAAGTTPETIEIEFEAHTLTYSDIAPGQVKTINTVLEDFAVIDDNEETEFVTISGIIYTELDADNEDDDTGLDIRETFEEQTFSFFTRSGQGVEWSTDVTTDDDGKYTVDVPADQEVYLSGVIEIERVVDTGENDDDGNDIFETLNYIMELERSENFEITGGVSFSQGGQDVGSETGADEFASYWTEVVDL